MSWLANRVPKSTFGLFVVALSISAAAFFVWSGGTTVDAASPSATFPATGVGPIPDNTGGCYSGTPGTLNTSIAVTGLSGAPSDVQVSITGTHTWVSDIVATLIAPDGTTSFPLFGHTGGTTATALGDSSDFAGPYVFSDGATSPPSGGWWQEAAARGASEALTAGTYRTTTVGGSASGGTPTSITPAFAGVANPNGTWTLRFTDNCSGDTGTITAASLTITTGTPPPANDAPVDFNGDGKTDYQVLRAASGAGGPVTWYTAINGSATIMQRDWGVVSDFFIPSDFDGDLKDDYAVWRPTNGTFYILNSASNTIRVDAFGQNGDDPTVVADYDGDGKDDVAVYRAGATAGANSTWYYRPSSGGTYVAVLWGQNGDFPAPGDYDGDGKSDFVVQRASGANATFYKRLTTAGFSTENFGLATDLIAPGDYDGDGKTDIATVRNSGGNYLWSYEPSGTAGSTVVTETWGVATTDVVTQGDYNGDGKTDFAVWRPGSPSTFYVITSGSRNVFVTNWGGPDDYPTANYNTH